MGRPTRFWFMRHGEIEAPYVGAFVGSLDVGLSPLGRHQAEAIAHYLADAPIDAVLTSPARRAQETAAPLARRLGMAPVVRRDLAEMDFGHWEGLKWQQIQERDPEFAAVWQEDPSLHCCPGGENASGFARRVQAEVERLLAEHEGRSIAVFAHAGVNRAVLALLTQRPYMESFVFAQDYGCVNAGAWDHDTGFGQVALMNLVPGPRSPLQGDGGRRVED